MTSDVFVCSGDGFSFALMFVQVHIETSSLYQAVETCVQPRLQAQQSVGPMPSPNAKPTQRHLSDGDMGCSGVKPTWKSPVKHTVPPGQTPNRGPCSDRARATAGSFGSRLFIRVSLASFCLTRYCFLGLSLIGTRIVCVTNGEKPMQEVPYKLATVLPDDRRWPQCTHRVLWLSMSGIRIPGRS